MSRKKAPELTPEQVCCQLVQKLEELTAAYGKFMRKAEKDAFESMCQKVAKTEFPPAVLFAMAKRIYAIRLEHSKTKQTVCDFERAVSRTITRHLRMVVDKMITRSGIKEMPETVKPREKPVKTKTPTKNEE